MKIIIFKDREKQVWLSANNIKRITTHERARYIEILIHTSNNYQIEINDFHKGDLNKLIYDFIKSDDNLKIIKVVDMNSYEDHCFFRTVDWVSQAMGNKS